MSTDLMSLFKNPAKKWKKALMGGLCLEKFLGDIIEENIVSSY